MGELPLWKLKQEAREYIAKCDAEHGTEGDGAGIEKNGDCLKNRLQDVPERAKEAKTRGGV